MKYIFLLVILLVSSSICISQRGERIYKRECISCHNKIEAAAPLTGPALGGITNDVSIEWLIAYTKDSYKMEASGDFRALCIWSHWKPCVMPKYAGKLTEKQISDIYNYISKVSETNGLSYHLECDSNKVLSSFYFEKVESEICNKFGLKNTKNEFSKYNFPFDDTIKLNVQGDYRNIECYIVYTKRNELEPLSLPRIEQRPTQFDLGYIELDEFANYLIVVAQGNYNEFDIQQYLLQNSNNGIIELTIGLKGDIESEVSQLMLN